MFENLVDPALKAGKHKNQKEDKKGLFVHPKIYIPVSKSDAHLKVI